MVKRTLLVLALVFIVLPLSSATTISLTLHLGESVVVNNVPVELLDVSGDGSAALKINGTTYVLRFGDTLSIARGANITVGSVDVGSGTVNIAVWGENVSIESLPPQVRLETKFPSKVAKPEEKVYFQVTVINTGDDAFIPLRVDAPEGWDVRILSGNSEITGVYLKRGERATVTVEVKTSSNAGTFPVVVHAGKSELRLTVIVEEGEVSVSCPYPLKETEAGEDVQFRLIIRTSAPRTLELSAEVPNGWKARFLANGEPVKAVSVKGESSVVLLVSVPSDAPVGNYTIEVNAGGVKKTLGVYVSKTHAGENGTLTVRVVDEEGRYVAGALVELLRGNRSVASLKTLSDGSASLQAPEGEYTLRISKEAYQSVEKKVSIRAGRQTTISVTVKKLPYYFEVEVPEPSKSEPLGKTFVYTLTIRNLGSEDDTYYITMNALANWGGMIVEEPGSKTGVSSVYIRAGQERNLYVVLIPPDSAELGNYSVSLTVRSGGSGEERKIDLQAVLTGSYGISIGLDRYSLNIKAGEGVKTRVRVYSTGTSPLTNVRLEVKAPKGWNVNVEPSKVPSLEGGEDAEFTVEVSVPESVDAGDYVLEVKAVSDQKSREARIRVTVTKGNTQTYLGLGIILAALIILGLVLARYGRR